MSEKKEEESRSEGEGHYSYVPNFLGLLTLSLFRVNKEGLSGTQ